MKIQFTKMQGAGNDFIVIDNSQSNINLTPADIQHLCHRRFGIGADGLILLQKPANPDTADAQMIYHNADGSRGEMCGNGARCFTAFALSRNFGKNGTLRFQTDAGLMTASSSQNLYRLEMTTPTDLRLNLEIDSAGQKQIVHYINTGVPHIVHFTDSLSTFDLANTGPRLRHHKAFAPHGVNVNIAQIDESGKIAIRTYERGVEEETLACGTGVTATALIAHLLFQTPAPTKISVAGGDDLEVGFTYKNGTFSHITLTGPAQTVFDGTIEISLPKPLS